MGEQRLDRRDVAVHDRIGEWGRRRRLHPAENKNQRQRAREYDGVSAMSHRSAPCVKS
jgi:hypothetical protein